MRKEIENLQLKENPILAHSSTEQKIYTEHTNSPPYKRANDIIKRYRYRWLLHRVFGRVIIVYHSQTHSHWSEQAIMLQVKGNRRKVSDKPTNNFFTVYQFFYGLFIGVISFIAIILKYEATDLASVCLCSTSFILYYHSIAIFFGCVFEMTIEIIDFSCTRIFVSEEENPPLRLETQFVCYLLDNYSSIFGGRTDAEQAIRQMQPLLLRTNTNHSHAHLRKYNAALDCQKNKY